MSPEPQGDNWLRASADANEIYARAYHLDPVQRPAGDITASNRLMPSPRPFETAVAERLREMTRLVRDMTRAIPQPLDNPNTVGELWQPDATARAACGRRSTTCTPACVHAQPSRHWSSRERSCV